MAFNDLLLQVGGVGRFQKIQVTLVILPVILMASHNTLQNFTAAIPTHHCRPPADTNLSEDGDLEAWLPRDGQGRPESCLLFTSPQRGPPFPNGTETNGTGATEPCPHGWIYDNSTFPSTIVTEVRSPGPPAPPPHPGVPILPSPPPHTHTHSLNGERVPDGGLCRKGNVELQGQEKSLGSQDQTEVLRKGVFRPQRASWKEGRGLPCSPGSPWPDLCSLSPQWDLVCSHRALRQLAQSLYMMGVLLGAMTFGCLADRSVLGRAKEPGWDWGLLG